MRCDDVGARLLELEACGSGVCRDGRCGCNRSEDCAPGWGCSDDFCACESGVICGAGQACCGEGEACAVAEVCEDEVCRVVWDCRRLCPGVVCGLTGDLCCEGDTPSCGPGGRCAPSCEGLGDLCGQDFDSCCPTGDVCVFDDCRTPGSPCQAFSECDWGQYCDFGLGRCMPDDFPDDIVCEVEYEFDELEPELLWRWDGVELGGLLYVNVCMTPVVADMTGNGVPDVVVHAYPWSSSDNHMPVVIDGATGETVYFNPTRWAHRWSQISLVDITGDGLPEMAINTPAGIGVIRNLRDCPEVTPEDDCYLWYNSSLGPIASEAQVVGDMTGDGKVEILADNHVLNGLTGELIASGPGKGYSYTIVADVTGNGKMEILSTRSLLAFNDDNGLEELWRNDSLPNAGMNFAAIGDVATVNGRAGKPEFVITGDGSVYIVAAETGDLLHRFTLPGGGSGGPPVIADFDGDGRAEVGVAGSGCYTVFDLDCLGPVGENLPGCVRPEIPPCTRGVDCFEVEACPQLAASGGTGYGILWSVYIQDISSSRTGSSVFDFQGDGRNEVIYNDECKLMVFDGRTGKPQFQVANTTRTASEYPVIVDVNADSRTNIVVAANNDQFNRDCRTPIAARPDRYPECHVEGERPEWCTLGTTGVLAFQDPKDRWVRTRRIWNQFAYHIDNVTDDARSPTAPPMPWQTHNTFRANRQGEVPLNAPDVVVSVVQAHTVDCPNSINFQATIQNRGIAAIAAGLPVSLFDVETGERLKTVLVDEPIPPGGTTVVRFSYDLVQEQINRDLFFKVVANEDGSEQSFAEDCNPESATFVLEPVRCIVIG